VRTIHGGGGESDTNDAALRDRLAEQGFAGPGYDAFEHELARYGLSVVEAWCHIGVIFRRVRERYPRIRLHPPADWTREDREDIASRTVATALRRFRRDALIGGGWVPDGGATLATYFIGVCLGDFPNAYRGWDRERRRELRCHTVDDGDTAVAGDDPAGAVLAMETLAEMLAALPERQRRAIVLDAQGYGRDEIAEILGVTGRAAADLVRRARREIRGARGRTRARDCRNARAGGGVVAGHSRCPEAARAPVRRFGGADAREERTRKS
jgi:DNA-directed RNA polymerase specialized sigma24 family protein